MIPRSGQEPGLDPAPAARSIVELLRRRVLDAELAALAWVLLESRVPVIVAGPRRSGRTTLLSALLGLVPGNLRIHPVGGPGERLAWLPEASDLGWRPGPDGPATIRGLAADAAARGSIGTGAPTDEAVPAPAAAPLHAGPLGGVPPPVVTPADRTTDVLLVPDLADRPAGGAWGRLARTVIRAASLGYGLATTVDGTRLEDVLRSLGDAPVRASDDELSHLGLVLVLQAPEAASGAPDLCRVAAAHYLRPVARDAHGHVRRLPPAVVATFDATTAAFEHFAWAIVDELAGRTGRRPVAFEREQARRASLLAALVAAGIADPAAVGRALAAARDAGLDDPAAVPQAVAAGLSAGESRPG